MRMIESVMNNRIGSGRQGVCLQILAGGEIGAGVALLGCAVAIVMHGGVGKSGSDVRVFALIPGWVEEDRHPYCLDRIPMPPPTASDAPTQSDQLRKHTFHTPWSPVSHDLFMTSQQVENHRFPAPSLLEQRFLKQVVIMAHPGDPGLKTGLSSFKTGVGDFDIPDPDLVSFDGRAQIVRLSGYEFVRDIGRISERLEKISSLLRNIEPIQSVRIREDVIGFYQDRLPFMMAFDLGVGEGRFQEHDPWPIPRPVISLQNRLFIAFDVDLEEMDIVIRRHVLGPDSRQRRLRHGCLFNFPSLRLTQLRVVIPHRREAASAILDKMDYGQTLSRANG